MVVCQTTLTAGRSLDQFCIKDKINGLVDFILIETDNLHTLFNAFHTSAYKNLTGMHESNNCSVLATSLQERFEN